MLACASHMLFLEFRSERKHDLPMYIHDQSIYLCLLATLLAFLGKNASDHTQNKIEQLLTVMLCKCNAVV